MLENIFKSVTLKMRFLNLKVTTVTPSSNIVMCD